MPPFLLQRLQALLDALGSGPALLVDEANLALANYDLDPARKRYAQAQRLVDHVLQRSPQHPIARVLQQRLQSLK